MSTDLDHLMRDLEDNDPFASNESDTERLADLLSRGHNLLELAEIESRAAEKLLGHLVRRGQRTIVGGHAGAGKSTFGMAIVEALARGSSLLGFDAENPLEVVYLDLEQDVDTVKRRIGETWFGKRYKHGESNLGEMMDGRDEFTRVRYYLWGEGIDLGENGVGREALAQVLDDDPCDVLVIDPLYKLLFGNPNEAELIMRVVTFIDQLRVKHGCAVVLPMHMRKEGKGGRSTFGMHDLYGAALWSWWAEIIVGLRRKGEGRQSELHFFKDRQGDLPVGSSWTVSLDETLGWVSDEVNISEGTWKERIYAMLQAEENRGKWLTREAMCSWFGAETSIASVRNATQRMVKERDDIDNPGQWQGLENRAGKGGKNAEYRFVPPSNALLDTIQETFPGASEEDIPI